MEFAQAVRQAAETALNNGVRIDDAVDELVRKMAPGEIEAMGIHLDRMGHQLDTVPDLPEVGDSFGYVTYIRATHRAYVREAILQEAKAKLRLSESTLNASR